MIRRREVDNSVEEKILTGLIVSDKVCRDTISLIRKDIFQNPYTERVAKWVADYYKAYRKAPKQHIQDIYKTEKHHLKEEESEFIGSFLGKLSDVFESEDHINEDYLIDKGIEFFKKRALKIISEKINSFVELDKVGEAEKALQSYRQINRDSSKFFNPFSIEELDKFFEDEKNNANVMFKMPNALGELIGFFERGTLVGVMAPSKRGKSFMLMEIALQAYFEGFKVLFISLEMNRFKMERRIINRITAFGDEAKEYRYPCFDCRKNQVNECDKSERINHFSLRDSGGNKPEVFDPNSNYLPCTACRGTDDFIPDTWFTLIERQKRTVANRRKVMSGVGRMYRDNFKLICYPKFSANVSDMKADIAMLESDEDFIPDVICVAEGSLVLTDVGLVPIEKITLNHRLWDGESWVVHDGAVYKGIKGVITYGGLTATPEHIVYTEEGWRTLESCRRLGLRIAKTAEGGESIRLSENHFCNGEVQALSNKDKNRGDEKRQTRVCFCRMPEMWKQKMDFVWEFAKGNCKRLSNMFTTKKIPSLVVSENDTKTANLSKSQKPIMEKLWGSWNRVSFFFSSSSYIVGYKNLRDSQRFGIRSNRQRWSLRGREFALVNSYSEYSAHNTNAHNSYGASFQTALPTSSLFRRNLEKLFGKAKIVFQGNNFKMGEHRQTELSCERAVWDIVNAGRFHRFTVQGLLVHNCVDYADILAPEDARVTGRDRYDETWKMLGNMADVRRALVVSASQTNRHSFDKKNVTQTDASEDIRKIANVEVMIALNQTPDEKREGVMRIAVVAGRDDEFDQFKTCIILQNLSTGQVCLDSEMNILKREPKKEKVKRKKEDEPKAKPRRNY